jgi:hypothetical protein
MSPSLMRLFWDLVNQAQPNLILKMDDEGLMHWLVDQVKQKSSLDGLQQKALSNYINDRLPLIRDMATEQIYL